MNKLFKKTLVIFLTCFTAGLINSGFALAEDPANKADDTWISVSGTVVDPRPDSFSLDYGKGVIKVEMDDWDWYREGSALIDGDEVTVYGLVDADLFEAKKIEANSVYVKGLNTYFYANDADEEDAAYTVVSTPVVVSWMDITGRVTEIDGREFTFDIGKRNIKIDTSTMPYNPMDDKGYQKIKKGDYLKVSGKMNYDLFEKNELMADSIITLYKDKIKKNR